MSASLMILIPLVLVGLVAALCFVGCGFPVSGLPGGPFQPGQYLTAIEQTGGIEALWPLNDQPLGNTTIVPDAADIAPKPKGVAPFNGNYEGTLNTSFELNQNSIVPGDNSSDPVCVSFNGTNGFVSVPFHQGLNAGTFTLEAWVQPNWTPANPQVIRAVLASANVAAGAGYALFANPDTSTSNYFWQIQIGTGGGAFFSVQATQPIALPVGSQNPVNYLAVTFDGMTLTLFVGTAAGGLVPFASPSNMPINYVQEQQQPPAPQQSTATPLFIGMGRPDTPGGMFPFNGFMQDVAIYDVALDMGTIMMHFNLGITPAPSDDT